MKITQLAIMHTFLDLSTTAYIGVESDGFGEGVGPSNELVETIENRPEVPLNLE